MQLPQQLEKIQGQNDVHASNFKTQIKTKVNFFTIYVKLLGCFEQNSQSAKEGENPTNMNKKRNWLALTTEKKTPNWKSIPI